VSAWKMDTTNGNPAVLREPVWEHCEFVDCNQHLKALAVQDAAAVPAFAAALEAAHDMAKWLGASTRRLDALALYTALVPVMQSKTRFASAFIVCRRTVQLADALAAMNRRLADASQPPLFSGPNAAESNAIAVGFKTQYAKVLQNMSVIEGLARLGVPFLSDIARMGSDTEYTASITQASTIALFEVCEAELTAHPHMRDICVSLQNSLLERCASHATATLLIKAHHKVPSFLQPGAGEKLQKRFQVDSRQYAAQVLDPAFSHLVLLRAGELTDVEAYLYKMVLCPGAVIELAPADAAALPHAPDSLPALKAQLLEIDAMQKPFPDTSDDYWAEFKAQRKAELKKSWKDRDVLEALEKGGEHPAAAPGGEFDRFGPLLDALRAELAQYKIFLNSQRRVYMADRANYKSPYGDPLGPKVDARYEFWPQRKKEWPLLFHCATQVLAGLKASTCSNERAHSVSGRVCTKLRGALLPNTIEQLTLAYYYIRREVIAVLKQWGKRAEAMLDAEDLEDARQVEAEAPPCESPSTFYFPRLPSLTHFPHAHLLLLSPMQRHRKRRGWEGTCTCTVMKKSSK
jgi:hypothetical protein